MIWSPTEIKRRREQLGLTQVELAARIGASRRSLLAWESGESQPQGRFYAKLVEVLEATEVDNPSTVLLKDAGFVDTVNHLVELYQQAQRGAIHPSLQVDPTPLPTNYGDDHLTTRGPEQTGTERANGDEG